MILLKNDILPNIFCLNRFQLHLAIKVSIFLFNTSSLNLKAISLYLIQDLPKCYQNGNQSQLKEICKEFLRTERISFYFLHLDFFFFECFSLLLPEIFNLILNSAKYSFACDTEQVGKYSNCWKISNFDKHEKAT